MVLTAYFALSSVNRACLPPSPAPMRAGIVANLVPASGDQDHTTSPSAATALVSCRSLVHRIPRPTFVTIAKRPSFQVRNALIEAIDLPDCTSGIFFAQELDSPNRFESPCEIGFCAQANSDRIVQAECLTNSPDHRGCGKSGSACPVAIDVR
jgi:hypothetical protein